MSIAAIDPYGNRVVIPRELIPTAIDSKGLPETIDSPDKVITRPAILTTTCDGPVECCPGPCINHYFRSIGWDDTMLISARKEGEEWVAVSCIRNPSADQLNSIFQNTRQVL